jgi:hypothetical protein
MRWRAVLYGAAAFLLAHAAERALWNEWFADRSLVPWFTNSGRAVLVTMVAMLLAELLGGYPARNRRELFTGAANVAGGGVTAMIAALAGTRTGTLGPIVMIVGAVLVIAGAFAGTPFVAVLSRHKR